MQRTELKDLETVLELLEQMKGLERKLVAFMSNQLLEQMQNIFAELEKIALRAEEKKDIELLQVLFQKIVPELDKLNAGYCNISQQVLEMNPEELDKSLLNIQNRLHTFFPNNIVHMAADTIANAGDYILVRSLKKLLEMGRSNTIHWCTVDVRAKITDDFIETCNQSKAILMGGGGLFLKDTGENDISGWQWPCSVEDMKRITTPIYVMGVGYNRFRGQEEFEPCFWESINTLVEKSAFFGLRNYGSIRAVQSYLREDLRDKVVYQPCATTVLSKLYELPTRSGEESFIALNVAFDRASLRYGDSDSIDKVMWSIASVCKKLSANYKIKCYVHCIPDWQICKYLDALCVPYEMVSMNREMTEEEYLRYFTEPELVLAIRGHAQMIPFGCKTPVVSMISHDKLKWFLEDIGHPEWGVEVLDPQFEEKLLEKSLYMLNHREQICGEIEEAQEKLWNIMQENLKKIL